MWGPLPSYPSQEQGQSMASALKKSRSRRKLNIVPAVIAFCATLLASPLSGLLLAQPPGEVTEPSSLMPAIQAGVISAFSKAGIRIDIDYAESPAAAAERLANSLASATTADQIRPAAYEANFLVTPKTATSYHLTITITNGPQTTAAIVMILRTICSWRADRFRF
jgi:hypothetical protein